MIGRSFLQYTVTTELGHGSMGRVYAAVDQRTGRRVALKFLDPEARAKDPSRQLLREARASARLAHPCIVALYGLEEDGGEVFLVEELVQGESLEQRLARGPVGPLEASRIARDLASALAHAHGHGVLHRDLKPANVMIGPDGHCKIADFGIAIVDESSSGESSGLRGTIAYMAPERIHGHRGDSRSDLFSLGAILYEIVSGRHAFAGASQAEVMYAVLNVDPPSLPASDPPSQRLSTLTRRLLAKDPHDRPTTAQAVLDLLEENPSDVVATASRARPRMWWTGGALLGVTALLGAIVFSPWIFGRRPSPDDGPVAVLRFENAVDSSDRERLGAIAGDMLVTSFAESRLNVISSERILDALHQVRAGDATQERASARRIARRLGASRVVSGSILRTKPLLVTAEVSDAASGRVMDATRIEAGPGESVFDVLDSLSRRLISRLPLPLTMDSLSPRGGRMTRNLGAYRLYLNGLDRMTRSELAAATRDFEMALRIDPHFEDARHQLAIVKWLMTRPSEREAQ